MYYYLVKFFNGYKEYLYKSLIEFSRYEWYWIIVDNRTEYKNPIKIEAIYDKNVGAYMADKNNIPVREITFAKKFSDGVIDEADKKRINFQKEIRDTMQKCVDTTSVEMKSKSYHSLLNNYCFENPIKKLAVNYQKNTTTTIVWTDGSTSQIKLQKGDVFDLEKAIAMLFMKKYFGNTGRFNNILNEAIKNVEYHRPKWDKKFRRKQKKWFKKYENWRLPKDTDMGNIEVIYADNPRLLSIFEKCSPSFLKAMEESTVDYGEEGYIVINGQLAFICPDCNKWVINISKKTELKKCGNCGYDFTNPSEIRTPSWFISDSLEKNFTNAMNYCISQKGSKIDFSSFADGVGFICPHCGEAVHRTDKTDTEWHTCPHCGKDFVDDKEEWYTCCICNMPHDKSILEKDHINIKIKIPCYYERETIKEEAKENSLNSTEKQKKDTEPYQQFLNARTYCLENYNSVIGVDVDSQLFFMCPYCNQKVVYDEDISNYHFCPRCDRDFIENYRDTSTYPICPICKEDVSVFYDGETEE